MPGRTFYGTHSAALRHGRLALGLMLAGAFCCPMSTWTLYKGILSYSDAFFLAALLVHWRRALDNLGALGAMALPLLATAAIFASSGMITYTIGGVFSDPINAIKLIFSMTMLPMIIVLIVGKHQADLDRFLAAWLAGATLSALVAYASSHGVALLGLYDEIAAMGARAAGLGYTPNALGYTCALAIPVAVYFWVRNTDWTIRTLLLAALLLLLYGVHASGSRASLLALLLALIPAAFHALRRGALPLLLLSAIGLGTAGLVTVTLMIELDLDISARLQESAVWRLLGPAESSEMANTGRWAYIADSLSQFQEAPVFGVGWGWLRLAHMHVLGILHAGGLFGLCALIIWAAAVLSAERRIARVQRLRASARASVPLRLLAIAGLVIWFVDGLFQPVLIDRAGYILIGVLFALDAQLRQRSSAPGLRPVPPGADGRVIANRPHPHAPFLR